jgi:aminoglycoside phosphotransferase (APT) family kinase protein
VRARGGPRLEWHEVDASVRRALEEALGAPVVEARNEPGGFSPGLAARCRLDDGRRAFIKAVSPDQNPQACRIHRREAEVASRLPDDLPVPRLRHVHDDGRWVALVFDHVEGRQPAEPWVWDELDVVIDAVASFAERATPTPAPGLQPVQDRYRAAFSGWRRLAAGEADPSGYGPAVADRIERWAELEAGWAAAAAGDTLLHTDLRADNLLLTADGVVLVDWPWACTGAAFVDLVMLLPSVGLGGGPRPEEVVARHRLFREVDPDALGAVVAALAGFFVRQSLDPDPPGLPTVRAFQRAQAQIALEWLRRWE